MESAFKRYHFFKHKWFHRIQVELLNKINNLWILFNCFHKRYFLFWHILLYIIRTLHSTKIIICLLWKVGCKAAGCRVDAKQEGIDIGDAKQ